MLVERRLAAVVNADQTISGRYPNGGPKVLLDAGIPILDNAGRGVFALVREGDKVEIEGESLRRGGQVLAEGIELTRTRRPCFSKPPGRTWTPSWPGSSRTHFLTYRARRPSFSSLLTSRS